nr:TetR/AcrR family transcriptional regulator [Kineosporia rhizophila]
MASWTEPATVPGRTRLIASRASSVTFVAVTQERTDGRSVLREQRHVAILAAARRLAAGSGAEGFTVDQVAVEAGVSRRTVFNHFATFEALLVAVCEEILEDVAGQVVDHLEEHLQKLPQEAEPARVLDCLCVAVQEADLPRAIAEIHGSLGGVEEERRRTQSIFQAALDRVGDRLTAKIAGHAPELDPVGLRLSVAFLMNGVGVIAVLWLKENAVPVTAGSRDAWNTYMTRLLDQLAHGYGHLGRVSGAGQGRPAR